MSEHPLSSRIHRAARELYSRGKASNSGWYFVLLEAISLGIRWGKNPNQELADYADDCKVVWAKGYKP
jgi:hypothetical protein